MKAVARRCLPLGVQSWLRGLYYHHPWLRRVYYGPLDLAERLLGRRDPLVPPRALRITGDGDFREVGRQFLRHFVELGGLRPGDDVLEVGCGLGRMAVALAGYLDGGSYRGFDIVPENIRWARRQIASRYPHFRFDVADIRNALYNPHGRHAAEAYRFPFDDASFDFVLLTSVFTHTLPAETANYLREIGRVLRPGGRLFATFFLIDPRTAPPDRFAGRHGDCRVVDERIPEAAIAYDEPRVRALLAAAGLEPAAPVHRGSWSGHAGAASFQDIVVAEKPGSAGAGP